MMIYSVFCKKNSFWWLWLFAITAIAIIYIAGMDVAPYLDEDEFMIVDLGRIILHPKTGWSITWLIDKNEPAYVFFYIGPVINEFGYQIFGEYGPRVLGIVGALMASTAMLLWLISRNTPNYVAFFLSLIFLLDPIFVQSYTLGRVDGWAMTFSLLACWFLRRGINHKEKIKKKVILASVFTVIAVFVWPSSVFLIPLILGELYYLGKKQGGRFNNSKSSFRFFFLFGLAGLFSVIILLIPILPQVYSFFTNIVDGLMLNVFRGLSIGEHSNGYFSLNPLLELLRSLKFTPVISVLFLIGVLIKRDWILILGTFTALVLLFMTLVYLHRVQYLLPYFVATVAGVYVPDFKQDKIKFLPYLKLYGGIFMTLWVVSISIVARSYLVLNNVDERDRNLVVQAAEKMIGPGEYNVYLSAPEFYLSGRALGWNMFRRYAAVGDPVTAETIKPLVSNVDYVILREWEVSEGFDSMLAKQGFFETQWYNIYKKPSVGFDGNMTNELRLRNLFSIYNRPYGPYKLYIKQDSEF